MGNLNRLGFWVKVFISAVPAIIIQTEYMVASNAMEPSMTLDLELLYVSPVKTSLN